LYYLWFIIISITDKEIIIMRMHIVDWYLLACMTALVIFVWGWCSGYDVAMAQNEYINVADKIENLLYAIDYNLR
jgi:hypothetical protein